MRLPALLLLACLLLPAAAAFTLQEGEVQRVGSSKLELVIVSNTRSGDAQAIFSLDGHATVALRKGDETTLASGHRLYVRDILVNRRGGLVSYYLWEPQRHHQTRRQPTRVLVLPPPPPPWWY
jgi:hypothetical protein